jgi:hypothetical protein
MLRKLAERTISLLRGNGEEAAMNERVLLVGRIFIGLILAGTLVVSSAAWAGKVESYSADQVFLDGKGNVEHSGKLYVTKDKIRMGAAGPHAGTDMIIIVRQDLGVYQMLNPQKKVYFERPVDEKDVAGISKSMKPDKEEDLGTETVSGYECRKKRVTNTTEMMGFKQTSQTTLWVSDQFDMPLRTRGSDGSVSEIREIKEGKPDSEVFEVPKGYRKAANMMEMFERPGQGGTEMRGNPHGQGGAGMPEDVRKMMPKGFKMPYGNQ